MTPFEIAQEQVKNGTLKTPNVSMGDKEIDYFAYELTSNKFHFSLMAKGMKSRQVTYKQFKTYYGLKSRSCKDGFIEFMVIYDKYMADHFIK